MNRLKEIAAEDANFSKFIIFHLRSPTLPSDGDIRQRDRVFGSRGQIATNGPPEEPAMTLSHSLHSLNATSFHRFFLLIILLMISMLFVSYSQLLSSVWIYCFCFCPSCLGRAIGS